MLAIFSSGQITKAMYDALRPEVNWEKDHPAGGLFHAASFDESGLHVADVWASAEEMDRFVNTRLIPAMQKLNIPPPDVAVYPVHNLNAYPALERYRI